jgi:hypothetical protein
LVGLTVVGSFAGVIGERLLSRVSTGAIVAAAVILITPAVVFVKARARPGRDVADTTAGTFIVAAIGAAATVIASRLVSGASRGTQLVILALIVVAAVAAVLRLRTRPSAQSR